MESETTIEFVVELVYQRSKEGFIRFRNNLKNEEMRTVIVGLFLGFAEDRMRKDIIAELEHYRTNPGGAPDISKAMANGLIKGEKMS